eukprot:Em0007g1269a
MRCILQPGLPVYCKIGEADYVEHFSGATTVGTYTPVVVPFTGDILMSHDLLSFMMERLGLSGSMLPLCATSTPTPPLPSAQEETHTPLPSSRGESCDTGYTLAGYKMNSLAYADDICLAASSKEETQHLLDQCMEYVKWAGFAFNTKKCGSLCLMSSLHSHGRTGTSIWGALLVPFVRIPKRNQVFQGLKQAMKLHHLSGIKRSTDQGRAFDSVAQHPESTFFTYTGAFSTFPQYRFIHKAILNLLSVRTVQARCRQRIPSTQCRVCGRIVQAVPPSLGTKFKEQAIPGTTGNNRPDLTIYKARLNLLPVRTVQARCCQQVPSTQFFI